MLLLYRSLSACLSGAERDRSVNAIKTEYSRLYIIVLVSLTAFSQFFFSHRIQQHTVWRSSHPMHITRLTSNRDINLPFHLWQVVLRRQTASKSKCAFFISFIRGAHYFIFIHLHSSGIEVQRMMFCFYSALRTGFKIVGKEKRNSLFLSQQQKKK